MARVEPYKPFPKTSTGEIDRETMKAQFLESTAMSLKEFCKVYDYDRKSLLKHCNFWSWRAEKMALAVEETSDDAEAEAVEIRSQLLFRQLKVIKDLPEALLRTLNLYSYVVQNHEQDAAADIKARISGAAERKGWKPRFTLDSDDLQALARAGDNLTTALHKALLIEPGRPSAAGILLERIKTIADAASEKGADQAKPIGLLGMGTMDAADIKKTLAAYLDPPQKPVAAPESAQDDLTDLPEPGRDE